MSMSLFYIPLPPFVLLLGGTDGGQVVESEGRAQGRGIGGGLGGWEPGAP